MDHALENYEETEHEQFFFHDDSMLLVGLEPFPSYQLGIMPLGYQHQNFECN
jgi:hypothetical protein